MTEQATPEGTTPRSLPDLGFFSGPARTGGDPRFGSPAVPQPSRASGDSRVADAGAGNPFAPAPGQFGSAPTAPFGTVPPPAYEGVSLDRKPRSRPGFSGLRRRGIIGTIVVLVVLGSFGFGRLDMLAGFFAGDLKVPPTLGGLQRATQPEVIASDAKTVNRLEKANSGAAMAASYTDHDSTFYSLVAQRVRIDTDKELKAAGVTGQGERVGESICAVAIGMTICMRSSRALSVMVLSTGTAQQGAAAVDEAWDKV